MNSKKTFRYDLIRGIAMFMVFFVHFNEKLIEHGITSSFIITQAGPNMSFSQLGVSIFLILSGVLSVKSLQAKIEQNGSIKKGILEYLLKRFFALMPIYYIANLLTAPMNFFIGQSLKKNILSMVLTLTGMNGYLFEKGVDVFYQTGEWFLGAIILCYLVCPVCYLAIKKFSKLSLAILVVYWVCIVTFFPFSFRKETDILVRIVDFIIGMRIGMHTNKVNKYAAALCIPTAALIAFIKIPIDTVFLITVQGAVIFIILSCVGDILDQKIREGLFFKTIISKWAQYSFEIYLIHKYVFDNFFQSLEGMTLGILFTAKIFIYCFIICAIWGLVISILGKHLSIFIKGIYQRKIKGQYTL